MDVKRCAWCDWTSGALEGDEARSADLYHFHTCAVAETERLEALQRREGRWHTYILQSS